ncbi:MAG: hypothetical protein KJ709_07950 [Nanoarchaeota archaeon]|nr:hypothetical protein [Nanoarchaeota archaeon]
MDAEKEAFGIIPAIISFGGYGLCFISIVIMILNKLVGNIIWAIGMILLLGSLVYSFKKRQGGVFRIANIVIKIILIILVASGMILVNGF